MGAVRALGCWRGGRSSLAYIRTALFLEVSTGRFFGVLALAYIMDYAGHPGSGLRRTGVTVDFLGTALGWVGPSRTRGDRVGHQHLGRQALCARGQLVRNAAGQEIEIANRERGQDVVFDLVE